MLALILTFLPWLMSAVTIYMTVLAGNKAPHAWAVGLGNQALWLFWIIATGTWGFLPMNIALWIVYARNQWKWSRMKVHACFSHFNRDLWPKHGPQEWRGFGFVSARVVELRGVVGPSWGKRLWIYTRSGACYFDLYQDRREAAAL